MTGAELAPPGGWIDAGTRLQVPPPARRGWAFRGVSLGARLFGRQQLPDIFPVFNINARLFWPWLFFASRLMPRGRLNARERELVILRTAWNCRCRYEWGQHVEIALRVGVSDEQILGVAGRLRPSAPGRERTLMDACDELVRDHCIAATTWSELSAHYDERLLIEIAILAGHYQMLAGFLNSAGLALEPAIERVLEAFNQRQAG